MADLDALRRTAATARSDRDGVRAKFRQGIAKVQALEAELAAARRSVAADPHEREHIAELERELEAERERAGAARVELDAHRKHAASVIGELYRDPSGLIAELSDSTPFLLLPVRIETKFAEGADGDELRVRIFPDDIGIAHHERALTVAEEQAGELYWRTRAAGNAAEDPAERERATQGAWNLLATRHRPERATWIKLATLPRNWSDRVQDPGELDFPKLVTKPSSFRDTPRSPVLPDRFAVVLERGSASRTVFGRLIPDDLPLGPDPLQAEGTFTRKKETGRLEISGDLAWLVDFDAAEAAGMAVRVPLSASEASLGFERIFVLGVRLTSDPAESSKLVERLFESHRYSQGLSLLPQGTPTNNTEGASSGLLTPAEIIEQSYALEHDTSPFPVASEPIAQTDGERLALALDIGLDAVKTLPNARRLDVAEAVAMERALFGATLGNFAKEMLEGVLSPSDAREVERFLAEFVHGRGVLPALRVGSEPYGIVVTSSFDDWVQSDLEREDGGDFWDRLLARLTKLKKTWTSAVSQSVRYIGRPKDANGKALDPFDTLLRVVGQQASSVEYYSRTIVPDAYIRALAAFGGNDPDLVDNWVANAKNDRILELSAAEVPFDDRAKIFRVLPLDQAERVVGPVIDGDPTVPLSETAGIRAFDGKLEHNYIDWLASASSADLHAERFTDDAGKHVAPPPALLYKLLRFAVLAELQGASEAFAVRFRPEIFAQAPRPNEMPNIAAQVLMPAHYTQVDAAKIGAPAQDRSVGDHLLEHARSPSPIQVKPPEAAQLASMTSALRVLAKLPTARLERLFAEHVDVASYRLDAWLTGIFARRLKFQRTTLIGARGIHWGAFGWVENVVPAAKRVVDPALIPPELRSAVDGDVVSYAANGGFVQAPSLMQAVTAAVLRNAYLTHAEPEFAQRMTVNLSSARVRTALAYVEGLQNGQELGALLGYQLERGLHEGHPAVELDEFIYVLRERFPLISKKLTPAPSGTAAEVVEARNVVNGYDLLDYTADKDYPYQIAGLPVAGTDKANAIVAEVDRLRDAMDAVADLLLAESVHQVVQGNYARARGAVQSLCDGELPAVPEVAQTPRSGRSLTQRVVLLLDPTKNTGWSAPLSPRAAANAPLNHLFTTLLPSPSHIEWQVKAGENPPEFVTLATLGLEPLDVVLMSGERLGDGSSQLERLLVLDYRTLHATADDVVTLYFEKPAEVPEARALVFDPDRARAGKHSLGSLHPLLKALRTLVTGSRALGARDFMLPTEAQVSHPENPNGYDGSSAALKDLWELKARLETAHASLKSESDQLAALTGTLAPLAAALEADPLLPVQSSWTLVLPTLRSRLRSLCRYGFAEALPQAELTITRNVALGAFTQSLATLDATLKRLDIARKALDIVFTNPLPVEPPARALELGSRVSARLLAYQDAGRAVLGGDFTAVPLFLAPPEARLELASALSPPIETDPLVIESWFQPLAKVRRALGPVSMLALYEEWLHERLLGFVPIQLPVEPGARWVGAEFGASVRADDVVSIAACGAKPDFASPLSGLMLDEWTELVPGTTETTGIALNINRPNAVAPQALLLAVAPRQTGHWSLADLVAVLRDTLARAKLRAVEPEHVVYPYASVLPAVTTAFNHTSLVASAKFATKATVIAKN